MNVLTLVCSIAAQTNFAIGAMLTAIFGVSIEIILYSMYAAQSLIALRVCLANLHCTLQRALQGRPGAVGPSRRRGYASTLDARSLDVAQRAER
jgi:Ca2+/H+ antiporter